MFRKTLTKTLSVAAMVGLCGYAQSQPCVDGFSGIYPCELIDQLSHLELETFDANRGNDVWGWTSPITGREYALFGLSNKTAFVDITSPAFPLYIGYLPTTTGPSTWRDIKVIGHYAYIVSEAADHGLQVFDLNRLEYQQGSQTPIEFTIDAFYGGFGNSHNVAADPASNFIYAIGTSTFGGGPHIVDVSDPLNPVYAGSSEQAGYTHDAQIVTYIGPDPDYQGKEIGIGCNQNILAVYDFTVKDDVQVVSTVTYGTVGYVHQGWFTDDQKYFLNNDELDELNTIGVNTRTYIWDMTDLDAPLLLGVMDLGTVSIDHNLYIKGDMVYLSNYTSGLRIMDIIDLLESGQPHMEPFGFFDVFPGPPTEEFLGTWSNYPYFESGAIPVSTFFTGLHIVKPNFFKLGKEVIRVCDESSTFLSIAVNRRFTGTVNYSVVMDNYPGTPPALSNPSTPNAPALEGLLFTNLQSLEAGTYSGKVIIDHPGGQEIMPFALVKQDSNGSTPPVIVSPMDENFTTQMVPFTLDDPQPAYFIFEAALDANFAEIVYQETFFNNGNTFEAWMPYQSTAYFWRIRKPSGCGGEVLSPTGTFTIDVVSNVVSASAKPTWTVYPNPAVDQITISGLPPEQRAINAFDLSGRLIRQWVSSGQTAFQTDLSDFSKGVYILKVDGLAGAAKVVKR